MPKYGQHTYGTIKYGSYTLDREITVASPTQAGVTHHVVLDGLGYMLAGLLTKSDITSAVPRVSIGTDERKHTDLSERDTWGQQSYHHGYGAKDLDDPYTFLDSYNLTTWIKNQLTLSPKTKFDSTSSVGDVTDVLEFRGNMYILLYGDSASDNELFLWNNTTESLDNITSTSGLDTTSGSPTDLHAFNDDMFIAQGEADNAIRFSGSGSTWNDNGFPATHYETYNNLLWRADNINELWYSSDPDEDDQATWQGPFDVGDSSYGIRSMVAGFDGAMWVGKDDGIYSVRPNAAGDNYVVTKVIDLSRVVTDTNGAAMIVFGGSLYFSAGFTLVRYDGSSIQFMGPDRGAHQTERFYESTTQFGQPILPQDVGLLPPTYQSGVVGTIRSLTHDNNFLYAAVDNEGDAASRVMLWTGTGWHPVFQTEDDDDRVTYVHFTRPLTSTNTFYYPNLWFATKLSSTSRINYKPQSRYSHNPLDNSGVEYEDSGWIITPWYDAGLSDVDKSFFDFVLSAKNLEIGGGTVTVEYQVDDYNVWYMLGQINHSPTTTIYFPDNDPSKDPSLFGRKIRYRLTLIRDEDDEDSTPIVDSYGHRFVVRPESRYGWNMTIKAYSNQMNLQRNKIDDQANKIRRELYGLRDKKSPVQLFDGTELQPLTNLVLNPSFEVDSNGDGLADHYSVEEIGGDDASTYTVETFSSGTGSFVGVFGTETITNDTGALKVVGSGVNAGAKRAINFANKKVYYRELEFKLTLKVDVPTNLKFVINAFNTSGVLISGELYNQTFAVNNTTSYQTYTHTTQFSEEDYPNIDYLVVYITNANSGSHTYWLDQIVILDTIMHERTAQYKTSGVLGQQISFPNGAAADMRLNIGDTYSVGAGDNVYAAADVYIREGTIVTLQVRDGSNNLVAEEDFIPPSLQQFGEIKFQRKYVFFTAETDGEYTFDIRRKTSNGLQQTTFIVDRAEFIVADPSIMEQPNGDYIDGDQLRCYWNGEPHNSTSTRQEGYYVYITTFTESMRYIEDKKYRADIQSEFNVQMREMQ